MGYKTVLNATNAEELNEALAKLDDCVKPAMLQICVRKGNRKDLGRPTTTPIENKDALMEELAK
jgi:phosphonopyruvate decarboxylase